MTSLLEDLRTMFVVYRGVPALTYIHIGSILNDIRTKRIEDLNSASVDGKWEPVNEVIRRRRMSFSLNTYEKHPDHIQSFTIKIPCNAIEDPSEWKEVYDWLFKAIYMKRAAESFYSSSSDNVFTVKGWYYIVECKKLYSGMVPYYFLEVYSGRTYYDFYNCANCLVDQRDENDRKFARYILSDDSLIIHPKDDEDRLALINLIGKYRLGQVIFKDNNKGYSVNLNLNSGDIESI